MKIDLIDLVLNVTRDLTTPLGRQRNDLCNDSLFNLFEQRIGDN